MLGPNDPLNPDIPDPDENLPTPPPADEPGDDFGEGDTPDAISGQPDHPGDDFGEGDTPEAVTE
jgi:hypothetical protein